MTLLGKHATVTGAISCVAGAPSLEGSAGGVLGVLPERRGLDGHCRAPAAQATTSTRLGVPFTRQIAGYGHDHRVCGCVTNCVTITTYDNGLT